MSEKEDLSRETEREDKGSGGAGLEQKAQQLASENVELRNLCGFLDSTGQRSRELSSEWQSFGQYTAMVLKNEVETYEQKVKLLEEQVKKLTTENKELREMCLYLDKTQDGGDAELTPPETTEFLLHTHMLRELNKTGSDVPQYGGLTSQSTLKDSRAKKTIKEQLMSSGLNSKVAMAEMRKRVERLEREKLELVKSLSAAHLLAAKTQNEHKQMQMKPTPLVQGVDSPPDLSAFLRDSRSPQHHHQGESDTELIMNAVTLLDVCRRLDASDMNGYTDKRAEAEAATLKLLLSIAWQRMQEKIMTIQKQDTE